MTRTIFIAAALALAALLPAAPAHALRARVFVSKTGADAGACSFSAPCQSLDFALNGVEPSGEITILDSGGYNPITITKGVTISVPPGVKAGITVPSGGTAITINAPAATDVINLNGLTLDGVGGAFIGIQFNSGGHLNVRDSVIRNFAVDGIEILPNTSGATQFFVSNTLVSDNNRDGILILPTGSGTTNGVLDHVELVNNSNGLDVETTTQAINVTFSDSVSAVNFVGIVADGSGAQNYIAVRRSNISNNNIGVHADGTVILRLSQSVITGNNTGWEALDGGSVGSSGDNLIDDNPAGNGVPPGPLYK